MKILNINILRDNKTGIFVSDQCTTITYEVDIAVGCVFGNICKNNETHWPSVLMVVWVIVGMWPSHLVIDMKYVYSAIGVDLVHIYAHMHSCVHSKMHTHTDVCMSGYKHIQMFTLIHKYLHQYTQTFMHICLQIYKHVYAHTFLATHIHTCTHK